MIFRQRQDIFVISFWLIYIGYSLKAKIQEFFSSQVNNLSHPNIASPRRMVTLFV